MALGGGTFVSTNKVLPGSYINFVNAARASASISDRGVVTIPFELDWGKDEGVFSVTSAQFVKDADTIFGYPYGHEKLKDLREVFKYAKELLCYRLNSGNKASNTNAVAKYSGIRGNDLKIAISFNASDVDKFDVVTFLDNIEIDMQTVSDSSELVGNAYIDFTNEALSETAASPLSGGTNATTITGQNYTDYLREIEAYSFNAMGCPSTEETVISLFINFTKSMRDDMGVKFQTVVMSTDSAADYEGVIELVNSPSDDTLSKSSLIYWTTGAEGACEIQASLTNRAYNGEYKINTKYTQDQLIVFLRSGKFAFHRVGNEVRVLEDINSLITFSEVKGKDFTANQTIRVMDQIANDVATIFNDKYLGKIPNDNSGRISLWNDIVKHHQALQTVRAIEAFDPANIVVSQGDEKKKVIVSDLITPTNVMTQLYMTVVVA